MDFLWTRRGMLLQGDSPGYIPCGVEIDLPGYHTPWGLKNWKNSANSKPKPKIFVVDASMLCSFTKLFVGHINIGLSPKLFMCLHADDSPDPANLARTMTLLCSLNCSHNSSITFIWLMCE